MGMLVMAMAVIVLAHGESSLETCETPRGAVGS